MCLPLGSRGKNAWLTNHTTGFLNRALSTGKCCMSTHGQEAEVIMTTLDLEQVNTRKISDGFLSPQEVCKH